MIIKRKKPRSAQSQIARMDARWPGLAMNLSVDGKTLLWTGHVRGFQMEYLISVQWNFRGSVVVPHVFILEPRLRPRKSGRFEDIPHLLFNQRVPEDSALCLFDPDAGEWDPSLLIADTTVPWATEWLHHYECWHLDHVWRGANAPGPTSIGEMMSIAAAADSAGSDEEAA